MKFHIWSHRHKQWWRANREGYTTVIQQAGEYTEREASDICIGLGLPGANIAVDTDLAFGQLNKSASEVNKKLETWRTL